MKTLCFLVALLSLTVAHPIQGVWKASVSAGCDSWAGLWSENYVAYNIGAGCGTGQGAYMGTYVVTTDKMKINYAVVPVTLGALSSVVANWSISGNTLYLTEVNGLWAYTYAKQPAAAWDGVRVGTSPDPTNGVTVQIESGMYLSYPHSAGNTTVGVYGVIDTHGSSNPSVADLIFSLHGTGSLPVGLNVTTPFHWDGSDLVLNNSASQSMPFVADLPNLEPATPLEGQWTLNDGACIYTIQVISTTYRSFKTCPTAPSQSGGWLGRVVLANPSANSGSLIVEYGYSAPQNMVGTNVVADYSVFTNGDGITQFWFNGSGQDPLLFSRVDGTNTASQLSLVLNGNFATYQVDGPDAILADLSDLLGVPEARLQVIAAESGSIKLNITVSDDPTTGTRASDQINANSAMVTDASTMIGGYSVISADFTINEGDCHGNDCSAAMSVQPWLVNLCVGMLAVARFMA